VQQHRAEALQAMIRDAFIAVLNQAADHVIEEMEWDGSREEDAINLLINTFGTMLDNPDVTVDEVMEANYSGGADQVRSWWPGWERSR
jgi:hypothetical protein